MLVRVDHVSSTKAAGAQAVAFPEVRPKLIFRPEPGSFLSSWESSLEVP